MCLEESNDDEDEQQLNTMRQKAFNTCCYISDNKQKIILETTDDVGVSLSVHTINSFTFSS